MSCGDFSRVIDVTFQGQLRRALTRIRSCECICDVSRFALTEHLQHNERTRKYTKNHVFHIVAQRANGFSTTHSKQSQKKLGGGLNTEES